MNKSILDSFMNVINAPYIGLDARIKRRPDKDNFSRAELETDGGESTSLVSVNQYTFLKTDSVIRAKTLLQEI